MSRPIDGIIKTVIIKRDTLGDFYIYITIDKKDSKLNVATGKSVGIDFGMTTFLTLSDSSDIQSPLFHLKNLSQQKKLNRNLSKKKKGSNNRAKAKLQLAKLHIKIANSRKEYFHKLTNQLANSYDIIFIEDLNMKAMQMMWGRKVSDLAFSEFVIVCGTAIKKKNETQILQTRAQKKSENIIILQITKNILVIIKDASVGEEIKIKGRPANLKTPDRKLFKSSMSRNNTDSSSCETIVIEELNL